MTKYNLYLSITYPIVKIMATLLIAIKNAINHSTFRGINSKPKEINNK